ncbi:MAG: hypothetical protein Q4C22_07445 [Bacillota bacterium]|nr:hypothetical protein [Bacillota bacterium]
MEYIIPGLFGVVVAIIEAGAYRDRKRAEADRKRVDKRAADRAEESRLSMQMMDASIELCFATALAVESHQVNGKMKTAKEKAEQAQTEYNAYIRKLAAEKIAKV